MAVNLTLVAQPNVIQKGQMLEISVAVTDQFGISKTAPRIYMEIIDSKGIIVWPLSVIAKNTSAFSRLISTAELETNTNYTIRIAINTKMIRQAYAFFKTGRTPIPGLIAPISLLPTILPRILDPTLLKKLIPKTLKKKDIAKKIYLVYTTELDQRVCPICLNFAGRTFAIDDPNIIKIGPPELGGETHYNCRCVYTPENVLIAAVVKAKAIRANVMKVILAVKKHKQKKVLQRV